MKDGIPVLQTMNWEMQPSVCCYWLVSRIVSFRIVRPAFVSNTVIIIRKKKEDMTRVPTVVSISDPYQLIFFLDDMREISPSEGKMEEKSFYFLESCLIPKEYLDLFHRNRELKTF